MNRNTFGKNLLIVPVLLWACYAGASPEHPNCLEAWQQSSAAQSCDPASGLFDEVAKPDDFRTCKINVQCTNSNGAMNTQVVGGVDIDDVQRLNNCNGYLKLNCN